MAQQAAASTAFSAFSSCPAGGDGLQWVWRLEATQTQKDRLANGSPRRTHWPWDEWGRGAGDFTVLRSLTARPDQGRDRGTPTLWPPLHSVSSSSHSGTPVSSSFTHEHGNHGPFVSAFQEVGSTHLTRFTLPSQGQHSLAVHYSRSSGNGTPGRGSQSWSLTALIIQLFKLNTSGQVGSQIGAEHGPQGDVTSRGKCPGTLDIPAWGTRGQAPGEALGRPL